MNPKPHSLRPRWWWNAGVALAILLLGVGGGVAWLEVREDQKRRRALFAAVSEEAAEARARRAELEQRRREVLKAAAWSARGPARQPLPSTEPGRALLSLGRELGADGAEVIDPCVRWVGPDCVQTALAPFFRSLDETRAGAGSTRVTVFGNSLLVSDRIVDVWRARLQHHFGDGGRGFLLADRMASYGARSRTASQAWGLTPFNIVWGERGAFPFGAHGVLHVGRDGAVARWETGGASRARLFWHRHERSPELRLTVDDEPALVVEPAGPAGARISELAISPRARELRLIAEGPGAVVYGLSLERPEPGVVLDTLAIIGADATRFLRADEALFVEQVAALKPDLVTLLLGGNEVKRVAWGSGSLEQVRADLHGMLARLKRAAPEAACLLTGPPENVHGSTTTILKKPVSAPWKLRWQTRAVDKVMCEVARAEGCAFFSYFEALGGEGALRRLDARGLLREDMIHPKGRGLDLMGQLLHSALLERYLERPGSVDEGALRERWAFWAAQEGPAFGAPLDGDRSVRVWLRGLSPALAAKLRDLLHERYSGAKLAIGPAASAAASARRYDRVVSGLALPSAARARLAVRLCGADDGCADVDLLAAAGGRSAWRERGLLDEEGGLTEAGARVAARLILGLLAPPGGDRGRSGGEPRRAASLEGNRSRPGSAR